MSLLSITPLRPGLALRTGIVLGLIPAAPGYGGELERAPDSGGSPGSWVQARVLEASEFATQGAVVIDPLPLNGALWWYRWRHTHPAQTASAWLQTTVARKADVLFGDYAIPTGAVARYVSAAADTLVQSAVATKKVRFASSRFTATSGNLATDIANAMEYLNPAAVGTQRAVTVSIPLPIGVTITGFKGYVYAADYTVDIATLGLRRIYLSGGVPAVALILTDQSVTANGWQEISYSGSTYTTIEGEAYCFLCAIKSVTVAANARLSWAEIKYTMPTVAETL